MAKCKAKLKKIEGGEKIDCTLDDHNGYHEGVDSSSNVIKWLSMTDDQGKCDIYMMPFPPGESG